MGLAEEARLLGSSLAASFLVYHSIRLLHKKWVEHSSPWILIGHVSQLFIYPVKSLKGNAVEWLDLSYLGGTHQEEKDRHFLVYDGATSHFYTARAIPLMVTVSCSVKDNTIRLSSGEKSIEVKLDLVEETGKVVSTTLHSKLRTEGLDCGDEVAVWLSEVLETPGCRLAMYKEGLFTERHCVTNDDWWSNNSVPKRTDETAYADLAPYMITTEESLNELNTKLHENVETRNFRPNIVVAGCPAWDEDRWIRIRLGETELECFKPCTRCVLTTVNPETGKKHPDMQPLKKLREFRLAPEGTKMRASFRDSPIFGVNAGLVHAGRVRRGDAVYVRYKKNGAF